MKSDNTVSGIYDWFSNAILLYFLAFLALLIIFISLDVLNSVLPNEEYLLKYAEIFGSFVLIVVTAIYAYDNHSMMKFSKNVQEIMYLQTRLEKLYYPLKIVLNTYQISEKTNLSEEWLSKFKNDIHKIMPYVYLSSDELNSYLIYFIYIFDKNGVLVGEKIKENLTEKIQNEKLSEEDVRTLKLYQLVSNVLPDSAYEKPLEMEIKFAASLYIEILKRLDQDILKYRGRLNELTTNQRVVD